MNLRRITDTQDSEILALQAQSDEYLAALYPPESNHAEPLQSLMSADSAFFAVDIDSTPVACGAVKVVQGDDPYGEIKRVFVDPRFRGRRLAVTIVRHLEEYLLEHGIHLARLEAGPLQPEALALYRKLGYQERGPFGTYQPDSLSVFMEKPLRRNS